MRDMYRTMIFGGVAVVSVAGAVLVERWTRAQPIEQFAAVGRPFFPEFTDPSAAKSLEVAAFDKKAGKTRRFRVEYKNGLWRIPTHHGYPAEAKDRLAKTAASVIGIVRESLAGRRTAQHARFGVLDPDDEGFESGDDVGSRITLRDAGGAVLCDYIVGKRAGSEESNAARRESPDERKPLYYVRRPDEDETYRARIEIDLSTKFSDWIDPDLLKVGRDAKFEELLATRYAFQEVREQVGPLVQVRKVRDPKNDEINRLTRDGFNWKLEGLNAKTEETNTVRAGDVARALRGIEIAGVRPKPKFHGQPFFTPDFRINAPKGGVTREFQQAFNELQADLQDKGFVLLGDEKDPQRGRMFAQNGQLKAATDEGIVYYLYFGDAIVGDESAIEVGGASTKKKLNKHPEKKTGPKKKPEPKDDSGVTKNRYLYLRVAFDKKYLGQEPTPPLEPVKPVKIPIAAPRPSAASDKPVPAKKPAEADDAFFPGASRKSAYRKALDAYEFQKQSYASALQTYKQALKKYNERVQQGQEKERELNARFADWYYVISSNSFKDLLVSRKDLINKKTAPPKKSQGGRIPGR